MAVNPTTGAPAAPAANPNAAWKGPINQTFDAARAAASTPGVGVTDPAGLAAARTARQGAIQAAKAAQHPHTPLGEQPGRLLEQFQGGRASVPWPPAGGIPSGMEGAQAGGSFNMPTQSGGGNPSSLSAAGGANPGAPGGFINTGNGGNYAGFAKGGVVGDTKPRYKGIIHKGRGRK